MWGRTTTKTTLSLICLFSIHSKGATSKEIRPEDGKSSGSTGILIFPLPCSFLVAYVMSTMSVSSLCPSVSNLLEAWSVNYREDLGKWQYSACNRWGGVAMLLSPIIFLFFPSFSRWGEGGGGYRLKYYLKGPFNPTLSNNQPASGSWSIAS